MRLRRLVFLALVIAGSGQAAAQPPAFSTKLEAVRVDVLVTQKGQVVRRLRAADFEILDNGVPQQVDLVSFDEVPLNVILAFDLSESVSGERLDHLRSASMALLDGLRLGDWSALVTFSHQVELKHVLTNDVARVRAALTDVEPRGDTALVDATYAAMTLAASDVGRSLLIIFSDGVDTSSWLTPERVLDSARRADVVVYSASLSARSAGKTPFLRDLSELTGGAALEAETTKDLRATFLGILDEFRQRYLVSFSPRNGTSEGWHRLEVRVKGRKVAVKARAGYMVSNRTGQ